MHKFIGSITTILFLIVFISPLYAIELKTDENLAQQASLSYHNGSKGNQEMKNDSEQISLHAFSGINGKRSFMMDGYEGETKPIIARPEATLRSYISYQNTPRSIVSNITIDFSTKKNIKPFDMDFPASAGDVFTIGSAFMTNLMMHEFGHAIVAEHAGASGNSVGFFKQQDGALLLGKSSVTHIKNESRLPYVMGGEFFADITFEQALKEYRKSPSTYNKSLLLFSGTDFLVYSLYAFSTDSGNASYDPVTISRETGISQGAIISVALAKTLLNAYRIHSGVDRVVPYFTVNNNSAALNIGIPF